MNPVPPARVVHLIGGLHHPVEATQTFWAELWSRLGIEAHTSEDIDEGCRVLASRPHDLLVVSALRWPMDNNERYAPHRERWAYRISPVARQAIEGHLASGGALLGVHAASICFGDWPGWGALLGGRWVWGRSGHPPLGPVQARIDRKDHPVMAGVDDFELVDEVYGDLDIQPDVQVLAHACAADGRWMPAWWVRRHGPATVCYGALGHDERSLRTPAHARALEQAVGWLLDAKHRARHEEMRTKS